MDNALTGILVIVGLGFLISIPWLVERHRAKVNPSIYQEILEARLLLKRADDYLLGMIGFGSQKVKDHASLGAIAKGQKKINEAVNIIDESKSYYAEKFGEGSEEYSANLAKMRQDCLKYFDTPIITKGEKKLEAEVFSEEAKKLAKEFRQVLLDRTGMVG